MPDITIITICFNNPQDLITTCQSVDVQQGGVFEHLIIDGSSKPDIKNHLEQNPQPSHRRWICERDNGIADAFNKGIANAKGDIIVMMNAGDTFFSDDCLAAVNNTFIQHPEARWLHGKFRMERGGQQVILGKPFDKNKLYRGMRSVCHQTMYLRKELYEKYGPYSSEKIAMDYDYLCRIAGETNLFIPKVLAGFAPAGVSSTNYLQSLRDNRRIYEKYYGKSFILRLWQVRLKILYHLLSSPIGNFLYRIKKGLRLENI
jgi:glycosyltransferase involved in cell wall biosynthesis